MIVYGYRNKEIELGTGIFYCPKCDEQRAFKRKKIVRYFTLFFIRLFPLGQLSEYVECQVCGRTWQPGFLASSASFVSRAASPYYPDQPSEVAAAGGPVANRSCLPLGLTITGILTLLLGLGIALLMVLVQMEQQENWQGFLVVFAFCPVPVVLVGLIASFAGLRMQRKAAEMG